MRAQRSAVALAPIAAVLLVVAIGRASTAAGPGAERGGAPVRGNLSLEKARAIKGLDLYWAGDTVAGLPLTAVERRSDSASYVSFLYGDCAAGDHYGCALPLEIQVWPACARPLGLYDPADPLAPKPSPAHVRGVSAIVLDDGRQLELETASSTVVIFGESRALVSRAAAAVRGVRNSTRPGDPLRPLVRGAGEDEPPCP